MAEVSIDLNVEYFSFFFVVVGVVLKCPFLIYLFLQLKEQKKWLERTSHFSKRGGFLLWGCSGRCPPHARARALLTPHAGHCHPCVACQNINIEELVPKHTWQPLVITACSSMFGLVTWRIGCVCFQTVLPVALNRISCTLFPPEGCASLVFSFYPLI